jgi:hypothetical protein
MASVVMEFGWQNAFLAYVQKCILILRIVMLDNSVQTDESPSLPCLFGE